MPIAPWSYEEPARNVPATTTSESSEGTDFVERLQDLPQEEPEALPDIAQSLQAAHTSTWPWVPFKVKGNHCLNSLLEGTQGQVQVLGCLEAQGLEAGYAAGWEAGTQTAMPIGYGKGFSEGWEAALRSLTIYDV
jgi:hypothetical protein